MRCLQCGMPLSPARTNCPRCGAPGGNTGVRHSGKLRLIPDTSPTPPNGYPPVVAQPSWGTMAPAVPTLEASQGQGTMPGQPGQFSSQTGPFPYSVQDTQQPVDMPNQMYVPSTPNQPVALPFSPLPPPNPYRSTQAPHRRQTKTKLGFTVAGMCFVTGALIMIFVFIMAQSLSADNKATGIANADNSAPVQDVATNTPEAGQKPSPTSLQTTPTPPATGGAYIDNTNLASSVDLHTGQPLVATQTFHRGQAIYVTMTIHQAAYSGAVCINWSINNQMVPYANPAAPEGATYLAQTSAYFYYKPGAAGSGYVDIAWSNTTACTNKVPVQHLLFTIVA